MPPASDGEDPDGDPLALTVERLRDEAEGLRQAMRSRANIEQAKGMLMERYGCDPDEAFSRLARLSQHANLKLADVASAMVAGVLPDHHLSPKITAAATPASVARASQQASLRGRQWPRHGSGNTSFGTRVRAQARRAQTRSELLAAQTPQQLLTAITRTALAHRPPVAAVVSVVDDSGGVAMLGHHGIPNATAISWQMIPVELELPVCDAIRTNRPTWLVRGAGQSGADLPDRLGFGLPATWGSAALLPLMSNGRCHGLLALTWDSTVDWTTAAKEEITRIAASTAQALQNFPHMSGDQAWPTDGTITGDFTDPILGVLDALFHPVMVCKPTLDDASTVVDFLVIYANPAAIDPVERRANELIGHRFLELYPDSVRNGIFEACLKVIATGIPVDLPAQTWRLSRYGRIREGTADVTITRYRNGVVITWIQTRMWLVDNDAADKRRP
jgi:hypothetical protein